MKKKAAWLSAVTLGGIASVAFAGSYDTQWALRGSLDVDLIEGNDTTLAFQPVSSGPVVIGLIDTGIDYLRPELADAIWTNPGEIAGNCVDDDGNGYVDDVHGIRVDVDRFDGALMQGEARRAAFEAACTSHEGTYSGPTESNPQVPVDCAPKATATANQIQAIAGLRTAYARALVSEAGNPLLAHRACPGGTVTDPATLRVLAKGDPMDYWYGHGTQMAGTMAARSDSQSAPASLLDLPAGQSGRLGDHVKIATCAAGFPGDTSTTSTSSILPRGTPQGATECANYFLDLRARGVNVVVINVSYGMARQFPMIGLTGPVDQEMRDEALFRSDGRTCDPAMQEAFADLEDAFDRVEMEDIVLVAAAHNLFRDIDDRAEHAMYPAALENLNVIGVGAINERGVWFGNRGRATVDLVAPGQRIMHPAVRPEIAMTSVLVSNDKANGNDHLEDNIVGDVPFDFVAWSEGTSDATAYVSTMVAILRANAATAHLTAPEIRRLLVASGTPLPSLPWMYILRTGANATLQALYWLNLGTVEPTTRTAKQNQLNANSVSGRIARLDRALECQGFGFQRIVAPVPRQVRGVGHRLVVAAESFVCAHPSGTTQMDAIVTRPDGSKETITLVGQGGYLSAEYVPTAVGTYSFALSNALSDPLTVQVGEPAPSPSCTTP